MAGIGSTLREAREQANLDIADFEARTKIRAKYLRAMEDEEWSLLPGYTFTKGFLRTYADMLGLDGRALVDEFKRQYRDPSELELAATAPARHGHGDRGRRARERPKGDGRERPADRAGRPSGSGRPPIAVAVVVLVVLLAAALYAVGVLAGGKGKTPPTRTLTANTTSNSAKKKRHHHRAPTKPSTAAKVGLRLDPTAPDYVCLIGYPGSTSTHEHIRVDGKTLVPGVHEPTYHDDHFHVTFGNNAVAMYIDDHRYTFPASPKAISFDVLRNGSVHTLPTHDLPNCGT